MNDIEQKKQQKNSSKDGKIEDMKKANHKNFGLIYYQMF